MATSSQAKFFTVSSVALKAGINVHNEHVTKALNSLANTPGDAHIFTADRDSIPVNRALLSIFSPTLRKLLEDVPRCISPTIFLPDCSSNAISHLLSLISNGVTSNIKIVPKDVLSAAKLLAMDLQNVTRSAPGNAKYPLRPNNKVNKEITEVIIDDVEEQPLARNNNKRKPLEADTENNQNNKKLRLKFNFPLRNSGFKQEETMPPVQQVSPLPDQLRPFSQLGLAPPKQPLGPTQPPSQQLGTNPQNISNFQPGSSNQLGNLQQLAPSQQLGTQQQNHLAQYHHNSPQQHLGLPPQGIPQIQPQGLPNNFNTSPEILVTSSQNVSDFQILQSGSSQNLQLPPQGQSLSAPPTMNSPHNVLPTINSPHNVPPTMNSPHNVLPTMNSPPNILSNVNYPQNILPNMTSPQIILPNIQSSQNILPTINTPPSLHPTINSPEIIVPAMNAPEIILPNTISQSILQSPAINTEPTVPRHIPVTSDGDFEFDNFSPFKTVISPAVANNSVNANVSAKISPPELIELDDDDDSDSDTLEPIPVPTKVIEALIPASVPTKEMEVSIPKPVPTPVKEVPVDITKECQLCHEKEDKLSLIWRHYFTKHFYKDLKIKFEAKIVNNNCPTCSIKFPSIQAVLQHLGRSHSEINKILSEQNLKEIPRDEIAASQQKSTLANQEPTNLVNQEPKTVVNLASKTVANQEPPKLASQEPTKKTNQQKSILGNQQQFDSPNSSPVQNIKSEPINCQVCSEGTFGNITALWNHYCLSHYYADLKTKFGHLLRNFQDCVVCDKKFDRQMKSILHIGTVHKKLNIVLKEKGLTELLTPREYAMKNKESRSQAPKASLAPLSSSPPTRPAPPSRSVPSPSNPSTSTPSSSVPSEIKSKEPNLDLVKSEPLSCLMCKQSYFRNYDDLWRHYCLNHFYQELKAQFSLHLKGKTCVSCNQKFANRQDAVQHIGIKHEKVNSILKSKGLDELPLPTVHKYPSTPDSFYLVDLEKDKISLQTREPKQNSVVDLETNKTIVEPKAATIDGNARYTEEQEELLIAEFGEDQSLPAERKNALALALDLSEVQVENWFKNRSENKNKRKVSKQPSETLTGEQESILKDEFSEDQDLTAERKNTLALALDLTEDQVENWFLNNRNAKAPKQTIVKPVAVEEIEEPAEPIPSAKEEFLKMEFESNPELTEDRITGLVLALGLKENQVKQWFSSKNK